MSEAGELRFTGFASLHGKLVDAPVPTSRGAYFWLTRRGGERGLVALSDADFGTVKNEPGQLLGLGNGNNIQNKPEPPPPRL